MGSYSDEQQQKDQTQPKLKPKPKLKPFEEKDKIHNSEQDLRFSLSSETGVSWEAAVMGIRYPVPGNSRVECRVPLTTVINQFPIMQLSETRVLNKNTRGHLAAPPQRHLADVSPLSMISERCSKQKCIWV